jgi:hypothetical protein
MRDLLVGKGKEVPLRLESEKADALRSPEERRLPPSHAVELRALAKELGAKGMPGVEMMSTVAGEAVARYADDPYLATKDKMDAVMRDLAAVFLGDSAPWLLEDFSKVATLKGHLAHPSQPLVKRMQRELGELDMAAFGNRKWEDNLDPTPGLDFKPGFRDGSQNQVFHTFAFVFIQYFGDTEFIARVANAKHELWDGGTSKQDFQASHTGIVLGKWLRGCVTTPRRRARSCARCLPCWVLRSRTKAAGTATLHVRGTGVRTSRSSRTPSTADSRLFCSRRVPRSSSSASWPTTSRARR